MSEQRKRAREVLDALKATDRRAVLELAREEVVSEVKRAAQAFLAGLDANDRDRLKQLGVAAYDTYVTELPGPNAFVKSKLRPGIETAIENLVADWCS
jgi:hypothetical protein